MPEAADRQEAKHQYLRAVCAALILYLDSGGHLRVSSERQDGNIVLTFAVDDADAYAGHLQQAEQATEGTSL